MSLKLADGFEIEVCFFMIVGNLLADSTFAFTRIVVGVELIALGLDPIYSIFGTLSFAESHLGFD